MAAGFVPNARASCSVQTSRRKALAAHSLRSRCAEMPVLQAIASEARRLAVPLPGILAYHSRKHAMATPTEHRANIITQDLARAEDLTRRQYKIAADIAAAAGGETPTVVAGVLAALALNFATLHSRRD